MFRKLQELLGIKEKEHKSTPPKPLKVSRGGYVDIGPTGTGPYTSHDQGPKGLQSDPGEFVPRQKIEPEKIEPYTSHDPKGMQSDPGPRVPGYHAQNAGYDPDSPKARSGGGLMASIADDDREKLKQAIKDLDSDPRSKARDPNELNLDSNPGEKEEPERRGPKP